MKVSVENKNYAAAVISFLDRDTGLIKTSYMYPITKILMKD